MKRPDYYEETITMPEVSYAIKNMDENAIPENVDKYHPLAKCANWIIYAQGENTIPYDFYEKKWGWNE